ncbi:hypothetical protein FB451DRAFT_1437980 [Mycena latifolia]|nr:hypothetical protein FB451DRAFT_1437980 [Mycena latifolia]
MSAKRVTSRRRLVPLRPEDGGPDGRGCGGWLGSSVLTKSMIDIMTPQPNGIALCAVSVDFSQISVICNLDLDILYGRNPAGHHAPIEESTVMDSESVVHHFSPTAEFQLDFKMERRSRVAFIDFMIDTPTHQSLHVVAFERLLRLTAAPWPHPIMSSPFTSKLGTNYCPRGEEIAQIRTLLVEPTLQLKRLDDEIAVLQKALDKLTEERTGISAYVDAHKALISPVRRLPLDIILEVFTACLPTHRNCVMSAVEAPMWLGRSGNCPLSISLQCNDIFTWGSQDQFIPALLPFASRWEHISFTAPLSALEIMSHLTEADVPMLKSVSINESPLRHHEDTIRWDSLGFLRAPEISSFSLKGGSFNPIELPLHWGSLINLSITETQGFPANETALQILSRCPQLRTCRLLVHYPPDIAFCRLFGGVSFPQLRNLKLRGMSDNENMPHVGFLATAPLIEKLEITDGGFSKLFLASFLRELPPTLRELNISSDVTGYDNGSFDDEILESLSPSVDFPTPCCPGLQALEIQYSSAISDEALLRFLRSRTLKRVVIRFNRAMELDICPELQPLVQNGLHLALTYITYNLPVPLSSPWEGLPDAPNPRSAYT